ncbi:MAG: hypothetical protein LBD48_04755, partial [Treponema sp.]|nr:hypothetical protein [Treponema sp.]
MKNHCQTGGSIQNKVLTIIFVTICLLSALPSSAETRKNGQEEGAWVFANVIPGKHRGAVTALIHKGEEILSAGEDGFIEIWNVRSAAAVERFQLSPYNIIAMAARPGKDEICLVENDGLGLYRIAVWNYRERNNLFTLRFRDPIGFISYSTGGNFIIAARTGRTGVVFIFSEKGRVLRYPQYRTRMAGFA